MYYVLILVTYSFSSFLLCTNAKYIYTNLCVFVKPMVLHRLRQMQLHVDLGDTLQYSICLETFSIFPHPNMDF